MRNCIHTHLNNVKKRNFMSVTAAIHELKKIEKVRGSDGKYMLDRSVTATQKEILFAFGLNEEFSMDSTAELSAEIAKNEKEAIDED